MVDDEYIRSIIRLLCLRRGGLVPEADLAEFKKFNVRINALLGARNQNHLDSISSRAADMAEKYSLLPESLSLEAGRQEVMGLCRSVRYFLL